MAAPQSVFARLVYWGSVGRTLEKERVSVYWALATTHSSCDQPWERLVLVRSLSARFVCLAIDDKLKRSWLRTREAGTLMTMNGFSCQAWECSAAILIIVADEKF